jgi:hypothetical protein
MPIPDFVEIEITGIHFETDAVEITAIGEYPPVARILGKTDDSEQCVEDITLDIGIWG